MKHNISDLLDDMYVDDIEMKALAPLSPRRIKNNTMNTIQKKKGRGSPWLRRIAVAAAVIVLMTVTVFAADTVFNDGAMLNKLLGNEDATLEKLFGKQLTENQLELVDDMGRTFEQSVTVNGATITPLRAVADAKTYFLYMRVEAPEGVVLPDLDNSGEYMYSYCLGGNYSSQCQIRYQSSEQGEWHKFDANFTVTVLEDENPTDNVKEIVVKIFNPGEYPRMDRNARTQIYFSGFYIHKWKTQEWTKLFGGDFYIDIGIDNVNRDDQTIEIDTGGVSFYNEEYDYTTRVNRVQIYALHLELDYSYTAPSDSLIFPYGGPLQIVMKDGTVINALEDHFDARDQRVVNPEDVAGPMLVHFDEPLVVTDIDYIILGGEHIFDVN